MKPRASQTPVNRLVHDLFFGFCEVTVKLPDGTLERAWDWPAKIADHITAGHLISPLDIGVELSWLILEVADREEVRAVVSFMRKREFPPPIRVRDASSTILIWRVPYFKSQIQSDCDVIRRGLAKQWPSVSKVAPDFVRLAGFIDDPNSNHRVYAAAFLNLAEELRDRLDGWVEETPWMHTKCLPDGQLGVHFGGHKRFGRRARHA